MIRLDVHYRQNGNNNGTLAIQTLISIITVSCAQLKCQERVVVKSTAFQMTMGVWQARTEENLHSIHFICLHAVALCSFGTTRYITESGRWRHRTFITGCIRFYSAFRDVNSVIIVDTLQCGVT